MKKTLLAAIIAASFGVAAANAGVSLPVANSAGNAFSLVLSGKVSLNALGTYNSQSNVADGAYEASQSNFGYDVDGIKLGLDMSTPFMGEFVSLGHFDVKYKDGAAKFGAFFVGVNSDNFGTLTVGNQASASDDMAYNGFDDYDLVSPSGDASAHNSAGLSLKYVSPDFNGVNFEVSLGAVGANYYTGDSTTATKGAKAVDNSTLGLDTLSLGVGFAQGDFEGAATFDVTTNSVTKDGNSDDSQLTSFGFTLGGGYTYQAVTAFAHIGFATNDYAGQGDFAALANKADAYPGPTKDLTLYRFGGQVGASFAATDADTLSAAFQGATVYTSKTDDAKLFMIGAKVAAEHQFNANFSAAAFMTYNHLGVSVKDGKDLPSANNVQYGVNLTYKF